MSVNAMKFLANQLPEMSLFFALHFPCYCRGGFSRTFSSPDQVRVGGWMAQTSVLGRKRLSVAP